MCMRQMRSDINQSSAPHQNNDFRQAGAFVISSLNTSSPRPVERF